jgi:DNA-binding NarL/FixJ family response regulator
MLPDAGGENVLRKIRAEGMPTRVTVCTGTLDPERLQELEELAPDALFLKPVSLAELYRACQVMDPV